MKMILFYLFTTLIHKKKSMRLGSMFSEIIPLASFFVVNQSHGLYMAALAALVGVRGGSSSGVEMEPRRLSCARAFHSCQ